MVLRELEAWRWMSQWKGVESPILCYLEIVEIGAFSVYEKNGIRRCLLTLGFYKWWCKGISESGVRTILNDK